jgi:hypothetical protein
MRKLFKSLLGLGAVVIMFLSMAVTQASACGYGGCNRGCGYSRCGCGGYGGYGVYPYMGYWY